MAAERAGSARKFDGVPAVGPDEGPGSKTRAEAAVWGHGEPRRERSAPYHAVGWTSQLTDPQPVPKTQPNPKSTIPKLALALLTILATCLRSRAVALAVP